ncbi:MAG TPA: topoisomerase DNA-binding C4 zinc finger domain-containing protein [Atribacteraceae bacterium]|nr:topoisomerase DNA-binding C4 zinc finger domain-containing protein [Atribacteraceae bacterium]
MEKTKEESRECPQCGRSMRIRHRKSDGKPFWGCTGFATEECRYAEDYLGHAQVDNARKGSKQLEGDTRDCPRCGKPMQVKSRRSDNHLFWGCTGYANGECRYTEDYSEESG